MRLLRAGQCGAPPLNCGVRPLSQRMQISEAQNKLAGQLVDLVAEALGSGRAVHPETAVACSARLAGSLLLRSFNLNIEKVEPGTVVLSNEANEQGPQLISILGAMLENFGVSLDTKKLDGKPKVRGRDPELSVMESLLLLQDKALSCVSRSGLNLVEASQAAAIATAFIVKECARDIGGEVGFNIAAYGFIEGSKTVPPRPTSGSAQSEKRPWYKLW